MIRSLVSIGLLLSFSCPAFPQIKGTPAVVVLRDTNVENVAHNDQAVLLDSLGNEVGVISDLGFDPSISSQNKVLFDTMHRRVMIVENARDRIFAFDYNGNPQLRIPLEHVYAIMLSEDAKTLGVSVFERSIDEPQMAILDAMTGKELRRHKWGGVALTNDAIGSQFWAVGKQVIGFESTGEIHVRRPLSRLPAEADHPSVINANNWCAIGVAIQPNENDSWRRIWVIERQHPEVRGSRNRLFAIDPDGQTRILVELGEIDPISVTCASDDGISQSILVIDGATGNLVKFNTDGELKRIRKKLDAQLVAFGPETGLWVAGRKSVRQIDPRTLAILAEHQFENEAVAVGLSAR